MPKFNPDWEIDYLFDKDNYRYVVIKRPEPIPGEKELMIREGCLVMSDGTWFYWQLRQPMSYKKWMAGLIPSLGPLIGRWDDRLKNTPEEVVKARLNNGTPGVIPAPVFKRRTEDDDNNWIGNDNYNPKNPLVVPDYVPEELLGDLTLAHLQLCDELQEGKPLLKTA